jgi:chemotaxis protein MotB
MGKLHRYLALAALGISVTGCVSSKDFKAVSAERDLLKTELADAKSRNDVYEQQLGALSSAIGSKDSALIALSGENADLRRQLDEINATYAQAMEGWEKYGYKLPPKLVDELESLASKHGEVLEFDSGRGMLKFKSDVTFALGSAELTPKAREAVTMLAKILASEEARPYELMVAGHTDAMPVSKPDTVRAGHRNNWYLSAHRAIAVGTELQGKSVSPRRLAMVGYAEQRPLASNDSESGRSKNRRVEVLILPTKVKDQTPVAWKKSTPTTRPVAKKPGGTTPTASTDSK